MRKEKQYITEAIRSAVTRWREEDKTEFLTHEVPGVHVNTIDARVARYGMVPHRSELYVPGRFHWYFKVEELLQAIGE